MPTPTAATPLTLEVRRAEQAAADIFVFELRHPEGSDLPAFIAGSHLMVRSPNGSLRKYSLCNDPAQRDPYVIGATRDPPGRRGAVARDGREVGRRGNELGEFGGRGGGGQARRAGVQGGAREFRRAHRGGAGGFDPRGDALGGLRCAELGRKRNLRHLPPPPPLGR